MQLLKHFPSVPSVNPDLLRGCDFKSPLRRCGAGGQGSRRGRSGQCLDGLGKQLNIHLREVEIPAPAAENIKHKRDNTEKVLKQRHLPHTSAFTRSCRGPSSCISGTPLPLPTDTRLGVLGSFQRAGPILLESQLRLGWQCDGLSASASSFVKWA